MHATASRAPAPPSAVATRTEANPALRAAITAALDANLPSRIEVPELDMEPVETERPEAVARQSERSDSIPRTNSSPLSPATDEAVDWDLPW